MKLRWGLSIVLLAFTYSGLTVAQTCRLNINADAPNSRYEMKTDGTVVDKKSGLTWMRCALGQTWRGPACKGAAHKYTWKAALHAAENKVFLGRNDWRLPNHRELQSLVEHRCFAPAINKTAFPNVPKGMYWWSSSPVGPTAWFVESEFGVSSIFNKAANLAVRLVRGGL